MKNYEVFTATVAQCKKYNIRFNDSTVSNSRWYIAGTDNSQLSGVNEGDLIGFDSQGIVCVFKDAELKKTGKQ